MRNNKLKQVFQSTTIRNRREISQNENGIIVVSHRETTIIPTKIKIKISIRFIVLQCLPLNSSAKMFFFIVDLVAL